MSELKPCPFCDTLPEIRELFLVRCPDINCAGYHWVLIDKWNRRASNWQPIATAPKDGTEFIALIQTDGGRSCVAYWNMLAKEFMSIGGSLGIPDSAVWQPIPKPLEVNNATI